MMTRGLARRAVCHKLRVHQVDRMERRRTEFAGEGWPTLRCHGEARVVSAARPERPFSFSFPSSASTTFSKNNTSSSELLISLLFHVYFLNGDCTKWILILIIYADICCAAPATRTNLQGDAGAVFSDWFDVIAWRHITYNLPEIIRSTPVKMASKSMINEFCKRKQSNYQTLPLYNIIHIR